MERTDPGRSPVRLLLLGADGHMGRRCASELLRYPEVEAMTLAGRNFTNLEQLAGRLGGGRADVTARELDIRSDRLVQAAADHDRVISCAGPGYMLEEICVEAAIEAGVSYISLNDDLEAADKVAARHAAATARQVTIISGCGASPGLTDLLVALAAGELDRVDEIEIAVAASSADGGGNATDLHFISMLDGAARSGGSEKGALAPHPVYFPDPVGWIETFPCGHPEELAMARSYPGLGSFRFRIGLAEKAVMDAVRAGIAARLGRGERRRRLWLKAATPVRPLLEAVSFKAAPWSALRVDVRGRRENRNRTISLGVVDHLVNLVSITLAQAAVALPMGQPFGIVGPDQAFEPRSFLRGVASRGITFARLEPHNL